MGQTYQERVGARLLRQPEETHPTQIPDNFWGKYLPVPPVMFVGSVSETATHPPMLSGLFVGQKILLSQISAKQANPRLRRRGSTSTL